MRRRRGQAMIEGVIAVFVLALLIFGTLDFSGAYWRCQAMTHAAVTGAEWAAARGQFRATGEPEAGPGDDDGNVQTIVRNAAVGFKPGKVTVHSEWLEDSNAPGNRVKVTATTPMPVTITKLFFPSGCGAPPLTCTGTAVRRILRN